MLNLFSEIGMRLSRLGLQVRGIKKDVVALYFFRLAGRKKYKMQTTSYGSLSHSKWDCKYHIVFVPKYRKKVLYGKIREYLKSVFHELANQRECKIFGGHMVQDHVHMLISIPPKYSIAQIVGYIKGKSAIAVARQFGGRKRNFNGEKFWARGYAVSTVGFGEDQRRAYVKNQEQLDGLGFDEDGAF